MKVPLRLPEGYYLDESDPDLVVLRRRDGSFVAAFSASGATPEGIRVAADEDFWRLLSPTHLEVLLHGWRARTASERPRWPSSPST